MRAGTVATVHAETMNSGTDREFVRVFIRCPMGHDLGSIPIGSALRYPFEVSECTHYAQKREKKAA